MYLSLLSLNPRNKSVQREQRQPYQLHRTLMNAFDPGGVGQPRNTDDSHGVLFRLDQDVSTHLPIVIVQSQSYPNWTWLNQKNDEHQQSYLLRPAQCKAIQIELARGQRLAFRLRANPTKRFSAGKGNKGKRMALLEAGLQLDWLKRKFDSGQDKGGDERQSGFKLIQANVSRNVFLADQKEETLNNNGDQHKQVHDLKLFGIQFDGVVEVLDPILAQHTIQAGIGSGKAFGFGLLSVALVR